MTSMKWAWALMIGGSLLSVALGLSCAHEDNPCRDGACECVGGSDCALTCDVSPCDIECGDLDHCDAACKDDCDIACRDLVDCDLDCADDCVIECDRLSTCEAACGARCNYRCADVSDCDVAVGPDSEVTCARVGRCSIECHGPCRVECQSVGDCDVQCLDLEGNAAGEAMQDEGGDWLCA